MKSASSSQPDQFVKRIALILMIVGLVVLFLGWKWGRVRGYAWKGDFEYTPRNTEEIPRPFEQVFENYVEDQWPFVILSGGILTACGALGLFKVWRKRQIRSE